MKSAKSKTVKAKKTVRITTMWDIVVSICNSRKLNAYELFSTEEQETYKGITYSNLKDVTSVGEKYARLYIDGKTGYFMKNTGRYKA